MRYFFDFEFIEDGRTIQPVSVGIVSEDNRTFYRVFKDVDWRNASVWVLRHVRPFYDLASNNERKYAADIALEIVEFVGRDPEFWAYYADYDWVCMCQLYGTMIQLPLRWPMYCLDLKQLAVMLGDPALPQQTTLEHQALNDAIAVRTRFNFLDHLMRERFGIGVPRREAKAVTD